MDAVQKVKEICKARKIPISRLEKDLGFGNAYISQLRKGVFPYDRAVAISNYLDISLNFLLTGEGEPEEQKENPTSQKTGEVDELTRKLLDIAYNGTKEQKEYIVDFYETIKRREKG